MRGNDTTFTESAVKKLKVGFLEKSFRWALWVAGVGDDNIKFALLVLEELKAVADNCGGLGVLEAHGHAREVLLGETNDRLVDVAEDGLLDAVVLDDLTKHTTVTTTDDQDLLRVGVGVQGKVGDHLLVAIPTSATSEVPHYNIIDLRELIALGALNDIVENKDGTVVGRFEDEDVLVLALLVVQDLLDLEGHGLAGPHVGDLAEPAI